MPDLFGPVTRATLAFGLWVVPLAPLAVAAYGALAPIVRAATKKPAGGAAARSHDATTANAALVATTISLAWGAWSTLRLAQLEEGQRFFLEHVLRMVRVGQLDVAVDLALDPMGAPVLLAVSLAAVLLFATLRARAAAAATVAWASLLTGAALLAILAGNLVVVVFAWELAACAILGLTGDARGFVASRGTDAAFVVGAIGLFWGLGGSWTDGDYLPDLSPRFAAVRVASAPDADDEKPAKPAKDRPDAVDTGGEETIDARERAEEAERRKEQAVAQAGGKGLLTMTAYPGALVFMDDSRTPLMNGESTVRAPFTRLPVAAGLHSFRIHPGSGLDDYLVSHVSLAKDREVTLGVFGATVDFVQVRDELVVRSGHDEPALRTTLVSRKLTEGLGFLTAACILLFVGAAARSGQAPLHGPHLRASASPPIVGAFLAATAAVLGAFLVLRLHALTPETGVASAVIALTGGASAVHCAWQASRATDLRRVLSYLGAAELGLVLVGAGTGAHAAATLALVVSVLSGAALWACVIALEPSCGTDIRRMGGLAKSAPTLARVWFVSTAASFIVCVPKLSVLVSAFGTLSTARVPGWVPFLLGVTAMGLAAHASARVYFVVFEGKATDRTAKDPEGPTGIAIWALAGVAAVLGAVLGFGGMFLGKSGPSAFDEWMAEVLAPLQPSFAPASAGLTWGLVLVALGAGLAGWVTARNRYAPGRARPQDLAPDAIDPAAATEAPRTATPAAATVAAGVERWILDGVHSAVGAASQAAALLVATCDDKIFGAGIDALAERSARLEPRVRATVAAAFVLICAVGLYLALRHTP
jgi:NADH-quinone oxidoreductase subunit L